MREVPAEIVRRNAFTDDRLAIDVLRLRGGMETHERDHDGSEWDDAGMAGDHGTGTLSAAYRRPLFIAFALTFVYMVAEVVGGFAIGSLALLSDATHMGTDMLGLGMALAAVVLAQRKGSPHRTYGAYRLEVLAALANGVLLFAVAGWILFEAVQRWSDPPSVVGWQLGLVAAGGLLVNVVSFRLLRSGAKESINVKGAYVEVLGDLLGSIGVIVGALLISVTGWRYVDPILAVAVGAFIVPRTFGLMRQALRILMEAAPRGVDVAELEQKLADLPDVVATHDVHVWTITSGLDAATGHLVVANNAAGPRALAAATTLLHEDYGISHVTFQTETGEHADPSQPC